MSQAKALYQWQERVATFFPAPPPRRRSWLALVSFGIVLALAVALGTAFNPLRQRLRKLYRPRVAADGTDGSFDCTPCLGPLPRWATAGFTDRRLAQRG